MRRRLIFGLIFFNFFTLASCALSTPVPVKKSPSTLQPFDLMFTPEVYIFPTITPIPTPISLDDVKFLNAFSADLEDWDVLSGRITARDLNAAIAELEGMRITRTEQKVMNGFVRAPVEKEGGQVLEALLPAEIMNGKLQALKVKSVKQIPVISSHAVLLEDYFEINFPEDYQHWLSLGATDADLKYAAAITVTWTTKYGPLRVSYILSGKYITEEGKYPGRLDFMRLCMFEQAVEHYSPQLKLTDNWYPAPIVGLSGTTMKGVYGEMKSDAFGWTPMLDFARTGLATLDEISGNVSGVAIESKETLAELQLEFDKAFMPVYCVKSTFQ